MVKKRAYYGAQLLVDFAVVAARREIQRGAAQLRYNPTLDVFDLDAVKRGQSKVT